MREIGADTGLFLESLSFSNNSSWYDQRNENGRIVGKLLYDEFLTFNFSGALVKGSTITWKSGDSITFINALAPDIWAEKPEETTAIITSITHNYSNQDAQKCDVSGEILPFAESVTA